MWWTFPFPRVAHWQLTGAAVEVSRCELLLTYQDGAVKLPQLVQQLRFSLVDGQPFPLDVYRSGGNILLPGQQHSRLPLIEAEENRSRLEFFSRRRVGVVGHVLERVAVIVKAFQRFVLSPLE